LAKTEFRIKGLTVNPLSPNRAKVRVQGLGVKGEGFN